MTRVLELFCLNNQTRALLLRLRPSQLYYCYYHRRRRQNRLTNTIATTSQRERKRKRVRINATRKKMMFLIVFVLSDLYSAYKNKASLQLRLAIYCIVLSCLILLTTFYYCVYSLWFTQTRIICYGCLRYNKQTQPQYSEFDNRIINVYVMAILTFSIIRQKIVNIIHTTTLIISIASAIFRYRREIYKIMDQMSLDDNETWSDFDNSSRRNCESSNSCDKSFGLDTILFSDSISNASSVICNRDQQQRQCKISQNETPLNNRTSNDDNNVNYYHGYSNYDKNYNRNNGKNHYNNNNSNDENDFDYLQILNNQQLNTFQLTWQWIQKYIPIYPSLLSSSSPLLSSSVLSSLKPSTQHHRHRHQLQQPITTRLYYNVTNKEELKGPAGEIINKMEHQHDHNYQLNNEIINMTFNYRHIKGRKSIHSY